MNSEIIAVVRHALEEDIGSGDVTSEACIPAAAKARGEFIAREALVLAGIELLRVIYELRGGVSKLEIRKRSGFRAAAGETIACVEGSARALLACERVALNF